MLELPIFLLILGLEVEPVHQTMHQRRQQHRRDADEKDAAEQGIERREQFR